MSFTPIYYISSACPTVERSFEMAESYIEKGASAIQMDMPSRFPVYETEFISACMKNALEMYGGYDVYIDMFGKLKERHPEVMLHLVVYPDVVESVGRERFISLCRSLPAASVMIAGGDDELSDCLRASGVTVIGRIDRNLGEQNLAQVARLSEGDICNFNYKKHREVTPHGCISYADKIAYIRNAGVKCKIYAVEGIADKEMMDEVKHAGADGALVGNVLMRLWDSPDELWRLFDLFQSCAG